jgi:hypothetical protein
LPEDGNRPDDPFPLEQPDRLAINDGSGGFHDFGAPPESRSPPRWGEDLQMGKMSSSEWSARPRWPPELAH